MEEESLAAGLARRLESRSPLDFRANAPHKCGG